MTTSVTTQVATNITSSATSEVGVETVISHPGDQYHCIVVPPSGNVSCASAVDTEEKCSSAQAHVTTTVTRPILPAPLRIEPATPPIIPSESVSAPTTPSMSGLLNSKNMDEKLVVATLATLNSGTASSLIKQDLKWIIQSRRKAEGKAEIQVEFKKPVKEEHLTSEEVIKRSRRRELNRLAARRSREKGQKRKDLLVEEIRKLQSHNIELMGALGSLTEQRNQIIGTLRQHMKQCSDYKATQQASVGLSDRVLGMLGFHTQGSEVATPAPPSLPSTVSDVPAMSELYISSSAELVIDDVHRSSASPKKELWSCPPSPHVVDIGSSTSTPALLPSSTHTLLPPTTQQLCDPYLVRGQPADTDIKQQTIMSSPSSVDVPVFVDTSTAVDDTPHSQHNTQADPASNPLMASPSPQWGPGSDSAMPALPQLVRGPTLPSSQADSGIGSSQEEVVGEDIVPYKHKLMKHRKQHSTDFTRPSPRAVGRRATSGRPLLLERSFSFPSSRCEQQRLPTATVTSEDSSTFMSSLHSPGQLGNFLGSTTTSIHAECSEQQEKTFSALNFPCGIEGRSSLSSTLSSSTDSSALGSTGSSIGSTQLSHHTGLHSYPTALAPTGSSIITKHSSLHSDAIMQDLPGVRSRVRQEDIDRAGVRNREVRGWASPMDTWPPAGSPRSSLPPWRDPALALERRWSVDDYAPAPLNLSRRSSLDTVDDQATSSSRSSSPLSQYAKGFVQDPDTFS